MKKDEVKDKTKKQNDKKSKKASHKIDSSSQISKKQSRMLSEILSALFGFHQEFLLDDLRWRRAFGFIPISYNINKLWLVKILMKNGKSPPFLDPKWDKIPNLNHRNLLILGML